MSARLSRAASSAAAQATAARDARRWRLTGGAGNPKSEIRNPKQIRTQESRENRKMRAGKFPCSLRTIWNIAVYNTLIAEKGEVVEQFLRGSSERSGSTIVPDGIQPRINTDEHGSYMR